MSLVLIRLKKTRNRIKHFLVVVLVPTHCERVRPEVPTTIPIFSANQLVMLALLCSAPKARSAAGEVRVTLDFPPLRLRLTQLCGRALLCIVLI